MARLDIRGLATSIYDTALRTMLEVVPREEQDLGALLHYAINEAINFAETHGLSVREYEHLLTEVVLRCVEHYYQVSEYREHRW